MPRTDGLTTGRVIHVNDAAGKCQAGTVAKVWDPETGLINAGGYRDSGTPATWTSVTESQDQSKDYSWHWPERA